MPHATPWQGVAADNKLIKFNLKQTVAFRQASRGRKKKYVSYLIGRLFLAGTVTGHTVSANALRAACKLEAIKNCLS